MTLEDDYYVNLEMCVYLQFLIHKVNELQQFYYTPLSCKQILLNQDELILMKMYPVALCNLRMCIKENNHSLKSIKGDNSREIIVFEGRGYSL